MSAQTLIEQTTKLEFKIITDDVNIYARNDKLDITYWNMLKNVNLGLLINSNGIAVNIKLDEHLIKLHFYIIDNNNPIITMYLDINCMGKFTHPKYIKIIYPTSDLHKCEYTYTPSRKEIVNIIIERNQLYFRYVQERIAAYKLLQLIKGNRDVEHGEEHGEEGAPQ